MVRRSIHPVRQPNKPLHLVRRYTCTARGEITYLEVRWLALK